MFSAGILGDGMGIVPATGEIYAPCDGIVDAIFDSRHAVSMTSDFGAELLIHCGIDTVELKGEGFALSVSQGRCVRRGDLLLRFDPNLLKERGYYATTPVIVVNSDSYVIEKVASGHLKAGEPLMRLQRRKGEREDLRCRADSGRSVPPGIRRWRSGQRHCRHRRSWRNGHGCTE